MEKILIPHGNELKILREFQDFICKKYCLCPIFPVVIREIDFFENETLNFLKSANLMEENGIFFLEIRAESSAKKQIGKIFVGKRVFEDSPKADCADFLEIDFSVVQCAEIEENKSDILQEWNIIRKNWIKITNQHCK